MKQKSWISIVFSFASQCRGKIVLSVLCAIISVVAGLIPYWSVYQIITLFIDGSPVMAEVWKWCWIGLGAYAIRFLLYGISTSLSHISAYTILENIRLTLAQRLMKAPLGTVIGESVGKLKSVLVDRVETIELPLAHMIPECISNLLLPVAVFVYLVCIDWRMALAMLVTVPLAFIAFAIMMKNFNKLYADYMESNNYVNGVIVEYVEGIEVIKAFIVLILFLAFYSPLAGGIALAGVLLSALFLHLLEARSHQNAPIHQKAQDDMVESSIEYLRGMQVVKAFKQEGVSIAGIRKAYNDSKKINIKIEVEYMPFNCLHLFSLKAASIAIVAVAALLTYNGSMELPTMLMLDMFSFMIFGSVEAMNNAAHVLEVIDATLDKLDGIEHADIIDKDGKDISLQNTNIAFRDVTFSYDKVPVLRNISFSIPQGSTTAIVGPSGSGKTTICNLIARFYDVDSGEVTVGGEDVRNMTCDSLLRNISMVFQKVYLFHDTIENNIRFGNPSATQEEIIEAAKKARCHDFIMALPDGYETVIGEGGSTLSGGEKQRISIARAILKNANIVILDEATASIDPENEHLIQQAISELTIGKTVIVIAHRLATIEHADQILVVDKGQVVQKGTHQELVHQEGLYHRFITIREQAEGWSIA